MYDQRQRSSHRRPKERFQLLGGPRTRLRRWLATRIGALFGLSDWRTEAIALAAHAEWLLKHCWKAQLTLSLPRLRPCAGSFGLLTPLTVI